MGVGGQVGGAQAFSTFLGRGQKFVPVGGHAVLWDEPLISLLGYTDVR